MAQQQPAKATAEQKTNHHTPGLDGKLSAFALAKFSTPCELRREGTTHTHRSEIAAGACHQLPPPVSGPFGIGKWHIHLQAFANQP